MKETRETIEKIIAEIEGTGTQNAGQGKLSTNQVMDILLYRQASVAGDAQCAGGVATSLFDMDELTKWRKMNNQLFAVEFNRPLQSNNAKWGKIFVFVKRIIRKLVRPVLHPVQLAQNEFNGSVTASVNALYNNEIVTQELLSKQARAIEDLQEMVRAQQEVISQLQEAAAAEDVYTKLDYGKFEAYFRGNEEDIKKAQAAYLSHFAGKENVVDLGCGRGEFLRLLKENGISAKGVDAYDEFVEYCKGSGLEVVRDDAISYLKGLKEDSLGGIFSAQLVEHLKIGQVVELCREAYKKLAVGSSIVLETPNPTCLSIYTNAFYIDPSHVRPVHPKTLEYILRDAGFSNVEVVFTESSRINYRLPLLNMSEVQNLNEVNDSINLLSDLIFGSQDYAIIATK